MQDSLLHSFSNGALTGRGDGRGISFPGLAAPHPALAIQVFPRQVKRISVQAGDVLSLFNAAEAAPVHLAAFGERGGCALATLGLKRSGVLDPAQSDIEEMQAWISAQGGSETTLPGICSVWSDDGPAVIAATRAADIWITAPAYRDALVNGDGPAAVSVRIKPAPRNSPILPPPLGQIAEEFTVSRATAQSYQLKKGDVVQIIDVEGQQCSDFMAFRLSGLDAGREDMIDSTVTRTMVGGAYPLPGLFDKFYDSDMRPLLNVVQDTVGRHDTFALACTARGYEERGFPGHVNCSDNISDAVADFGVGRRSAWPAINFFFNSWIDHTANQLQSQEAQSRPGDYVAMQAMDDLLCVTTACPDDIDPINGWNPTDVHVRIYRPDVPIRKAIAYREKEDAAVSLSQNSAFHPRTSTLTQNFAAVRDLWMPQSYPALGTTGEYWACREAATLQDMSSLRKYDIVGPDAEALLQYAMTRDIARLAAWRGTYALICDNLGTVIDDGTLFRLGPDLFRWCCGSEESGRVLTELAKDRGLRVRIKDLGGSMPNLALQGPKSRDILRCLMFTQPHVPALDDLKWFGVTMARLQNRDGLPFMVSRSGYTGELGYELFVSASDAIELWDAVMAAGASFGLEPMGASALEIIRIEAGLAAGGAEFAPDIDAFEAGLGFAVDFRKADFQGRGALSRNAEVPRRVLRGLILDGDDVPPPGTHLALGERPVGVVTSSTRSPILEQAIAIVRLAVEHSAPGTELEVVTSSAHMKRLSGTVCDIPFVDPTRSRARA
ncbi:MAG: DUF1989 domain-containing protein [Pseudomonadota bacterium]